MLVSMPFMSRQPAQPVPKTTTLGFSPGFVGAKPLKGEDSDAASAAGVGGCCRVDEDAQKFREEVKGLRGEKVVCFVEHLLEMLMRFLNQTMIQFEGERS
eukprot:TRINITY_DN4387_c1_g1_i1.p3 TRINITY_DN4387_c1_g1~~TRINITY_DN4387_c1_g1_i1.p3  ORF type:complete len:100 (-),score=10.88 TRINITY_DN4387_c1_g1_i1:219-518(-)